MFDPNTGAMWCEDCKEAGIQSELKETYGPGVIIMRCPKCLSEEGYAIINQHVVLDPKKEPDNG